MNAPGRVEEPRPLSAHLLVVVASAMLWITEQLPPWLVAVQIAAIGWATWRRDDPHPWQRSPIALNVGMLGITVTTISVALRGHPSTLSLAHFAALTQGLQLLDVRPRKSEFLLVALALFQVILAANLTDSVLFPPLLAVFTAAVTWTLLVHTLRTEALAAGDRVGAEKALTSNLARTTLLASVASIALALVFFVSLPRLRGSIVSGGVQGTTALSGFSDRVELGTIGRIRSDPSVVLRVETLEGPAPDPAGAYWRGLAFDRFDGRSWSIAPISDFRARKALASSPRIGVDIGAGDPGPSGDRSEGVRLVQRIIREPVASGVLFGSGDPRRIEGPLDLLEMDRNGGLYAPAEVDQRIRYTIWSRSDARDDAALRADRALPPQPRNPPSGDGARYLALPELAPRIGALAERIVSDLDAPSERAAAIERWLRAEGRYTDEPPTVDDASGQTPIEAFLLDGLAGHCEYFASSMVVLARSLGLPARLVNGFAGGRLNELGGFISVTRADAHAWVEVHYEQAGWVRYDPTPPDLRLRAMAELGMMERMAELGSALETWWFQRVVDFDSSDQFAAIRAGLSAWKRFKTSSATRTGKTVKRWKGAPTSADLADALPAALLLLAAMLAAAFGVRRLRAAPAAADRVPRAYREALALLRRRGVTRAECSSGRDFARSAGQQLPCDAAHAFAELTEIYLAERFGGCAATEAGERALGTLRSALARTRQSRA